MKRAGTFRLMSAIGTLVLLLSVALGTFYFHAGAITHAAKAPVAHPVFVRPPTLVARTNPNGNPKFSCQNPGASVRCYAPTQIRTAYDIQRVLDAGITGKGTTIVIIDAFQSPTIQQDLNLFDKTFGLHAPTLHIIAPFGLTPFNPNDPTQVSWSAEISLDVEWSHAIAPDATIDLVLAKSNMDADLLSVTKYAVDHNLGNVISQSFSEAESCVDPTIVAQEHAVYQQAVAEGITLFASTGDTGAAQYSCDGSTLILSAGFPATDPLVTSVGGTYLNANPQSGRYHGEKAWNDSFGASGGGFSILYPRPLYQEGANHNSQRGVPDLSFDADVNGGVLVVWGEGPNGAHGIYIFGGTSVGSPAMAGEIALVNQAFGKRLGNLNKSLYLSLGIPGTYQIVFHDITVGTNTFTGAGSNGKVVTINGYSTRTGWDAVTGQGTLDLGNAFYGPSGSKFSPQSIFLAK